MSSNTAATLGIIYIALGFAAILGWVMNLIAVFGADLSAVSGEEVLRIVGIVLSPIGAFMGWM